MSKGAGRVEQAIRAILDTRRHAQRFTADTITEAAFGPPPWTASQRHSALRAMHRIIAGQPEWAVQHSEPEWAVRRAKRHPAGTRPPLLPVLAKRHRTVFVFDPEALIPYVSSGPGARESLDAIVNAGHLHPADRLVKRPKSIRRRAQERIERAARHEELVAIKARHHEKMLAKWEKRRQRRLAKLDGDDDALDAMFDGPPDDEVLADGLETLFNMPRGSTFGDVRKMLAAQAQDAATAGRGTGQEMTAPMIERPHSAL